MGRGDTDSCLSICFRPITGDGLNLSGLKYIFVIRAFIYILLYYMYSKNKISSIRILNVPQERRSTWHAHERYSLWLLLVYIFGGIQKFLCLSWSASMFTSPNIIFGVCTTSEIIIIFFVLQKCILCNIITTTEKYNMFNRYLFNN